MSHRTWAPWMALGLVAGSLVASPARAQVTPPQEYAKFVGKSSSVEAFADFGDQISLRDGKLVLRTTDIELPGTGPMIRLTRTFNPDSFGVNTYENSGNGFGGWQIEVPRIKTITSNTLGASVYSPFGWQVIGSTTAEKNARCTRFAAPGRTNFPTDAARGWNAYEWWNGYHLVDDTGNDQLVMTRSDKSVRPDIALMTTGNWLVGCLPTTTSGEPGEAFYALSPDGTKYWFDNLVYVSSDDLQKPLWSNTPTQLKTPSSSAGTNKAGKGSTPTPQFVAFSDYLERRYAAMLVTRVEDRFGNWLTYHYTSGRLDSIDASDGRHVGLTYGTPGSATVTVGSGASAKTWAYAYIEGDPATSVPSQQLTVTRPDGSTWKYALNWQVASSASMADLEGGAQTCPFDSVDYGTGAEQTIISPAGATLTLRLTYKRFGRSYVPKVCWGENPNTPNSGFMKYPNEWFAFAVTSRTVSGPGLTTAVWNYTYAPPNSSWLENCPTPTSCASTVWTDVTSPDGSRRRSIFSNKFDETENKLLREEDYTASSQLLRSKDFLYATVASLMTNPYAWPVQVGNDQQTRGNSQTSGQWAPPRQTVTTQQGRSFTWQVPSTCLGGSSPCFDSFARPTKITKSSSP